MSEVTGEALPSKAEYLKKYLSGGGASAKKGKKKSKKGASGR